MHRRSYVGLGVLAVVAVLFAASSGGVAVAQSANQTVNASGNQTEASVVFKNQTTNGTTVTIKSATLPDGGFIVLSNDPYKEIGILGNSMIAVSKPLSPGTHHLDFVTI